MTICIGCFCLLTYINCWKLTLTTLQICIYLPITTLPSPSNIISPTLLQLQTVLEFFILPSKTTTEPHPFTLHLCPKNSYHQSRNMGKEYIITKFTFWKDIYSFIRQQHTNTAKYRNFVLSGFATLKISKLSNHIFSK